MNITAVEWLEEKIKTYLPSIHQKGLEDVFTQAKEMEVKQREAEYKRGWEDRKLVNVSWTDGPIMTFGKHNIKDEDLNK